MYGQRDSCTVLSDFTVHSAFTLQLSQLYWYDAGDTSMIASQDWLALELGPQVWEKLSSSSDQLAVNKTTIMMPELTIRLVHHVHHPVHLKRP